MRMTENNGQSENASGRDVSPTPPRGVEIIDHERKLHMYRITEDELEALVTVGNMKTLDVGLLLFFLGAFLSFLVALIAEAPDDRLVADLFIIACVGSGIMTVVFLGRTVFAFRREGQSVRRIKGSKD